MRQVKTPEKYETVMVHYRNWFGFRRTCFIGHNDPGEKTMDIYVPGLLTAKQAFEICEHVRISLVMDESRWKHDNDIQDSVTYDSVNDMMGCMDCEHEDERKCPNCPAKLGKDYGCEILTFVSNKENE